MEPIADERNKRGRVFWTVTALIGGETALFTLVIPALPIFADRYGLSDGAVAMLFGVFPLAQLIASIPLATSIDRLGRRPVMVGGALALLVATIGFALADSVPALVLTRALQGVAAALVWTAGLAAISDVYPQSELGLRIGLAETVGGGVGLIGPVAGGFLLDLVGTEEAFALAALIPLALLPFAFWVPETARPGEGPPPLLEALRRLGGRVEAKAGISSLVAFAGGLAVVDSLLPLDLDRRLDASSAEIGIVFGVGFAAVLFTAPIAGAWSDRHGRRRALLAGGLASAAAMPLVAVGPLWMVAIGFALLGCGLATLAAPSAPLIILAADRSGMEGMYGVSAAVINLVFAAGYAFGPLLGGAAALAVPFAAIAAGSAVLLAVLAILSFRILPKGT